MENESGIILGLFLGQYYLMVKIKESGKSPLSQVVKITQKV